MKFFSFRNFAIVTAFAIICQINAMETGKPAQKAILAIDTGVLAPNIDKNKIIKKALTVAPVLLIKHPTIFWNAKSIANSAVDISKNTKGITNVLNELNTYLNQQNYGTLSDDEIKAVLQLAVAAAPQNDAFEFLKTARKKKFKTMAITNRDYEEFEMFKSELSKNHKIDLDKLFDGFVTAPVNTMNFGNDDFIEKSNNLFVSKDRMPGKAFGTTILAMANIIEKGVPITLILQNQDYLKQLEDVEKGIQGFCYSSVADLYEILKKKKTTENKEELSSLEDVD